jgi:hypothetical protein
MILKRTISRKRKETLNKNIKIAVSPQKGRKQDWETFKASNEE